MVENHRFTINKENKRIVKMHLPNLNYKLVAIISGCSLLFGILNGYVIFPRILKAVLTRVRITFGYTGREGYNLK